MSICPPRFVLDGLAARSLCPMCFVRTPGRHLRAANAAAAGPPEEAYRCLPRRGGARYKQERRCLQRSPSGRRAKAKHCARCVECTRTNVVCVRAVQSRPPASCGDLSLSPPSPIVSRRLVYPPPSPDSLFSCSLEDTRACSGGAAGGSSRLWQADCCAELWCAARTPCEFWRQKPRGCRASAEPQHGEQSRVI